MSEIAELKSLVTQLAEEVAFLRAAFGVPSDEAIVGADYVARLIDCDAESVVRKRFGTGSLRRVREKPVGFVKKEVDAWHKNNITPKAEKAAEIRRLTKPRKRRTNNAKK